MVGLIGKSDDLPIFMLAIIGGVIVIIALSSFTRANATTISRGISILITVCGVALIGGAEWLRRLDTTVRQTMRVLVWCSIGLAVATMLGVFVLLHQYSVGSTFVNPGLEIFRLAAVGAIGGAIIGGYDLLRFQEHHKANRTQEALEELVTAAPAPIIALDTEGRVELWNGAAERLFGYAAEEVIGDRYPLVPSGKEAEFQAHLDQILANESLRSIETTRQRKDGSSITVRIYARPLHDSDGEVRGLIAILADVTDQKRRQEQLAVLNRVLRHNLRNDLTVIIGTADELIGRFDKFEQALDEEYSEQGGGIVGLKAATETCVEYDEVTPVAAAIEEAVASSASPSSKQLALNIREAAQDLAGIGDKARTIEAMLQEGTTTSQSRSIRPLVAGAISEVESEYPAVKFTSQIESLEGVSVVGPAQLAQALYELLENAVIHHDGEAPSVTITAAVTEARVTLRVIDDGPGIPLQEREVLEQGSESALTHGSGLGLWFVNWCISMANGTLTISDSDTGGAVVKLELPRDNYQSREQPDSQERPQVEKWPDNNLS